MPYYAVANGQTVGIFTNWNECKASVIGYKGAKYKKFETTDEAAQYIADYQANRCSSTMNTNTASRFVPDYYVYTDGSCIHNGKPEAKAGIGIYFGADDPRNVSRTVVAEKVTNNVAELTAISEAHRIINADLRAGKRIEIVTDSAYAIKCATSYGDKCNTSNWEQDIPNKVLVKQVYEMYRNERNVQFAHIMAHTENQDIHSIGNSHADRLANEAIFQGGST